MKFDDKYFIANQVKDYRKRAKLTQSELAEKVDISVQHVSRIESGRYIPSLKTFFTIAEVLDIDLRIFGFNAPFSDDNRKEKLIQTIMSANEEKLTLFEDIIFAIDKTLTKINH